MNVDPWNAQKLMRTSGAFWESCALHAGVELDVFSAIGDTSLTGDEVAGTLGGDVRGITALLNALAAMGLLIKHEGRFANTSVSRTLLARDSPQYIGYMIRHHHHLVPAWSELHRAARTGKPVRERTGDEEEIESFLMGMFNQAMGFAPRLARELDLSGRHRLLDLGGGPGTYAIHFCLANPGLRACVFDLPAAREFALKAAKRFGVRDRIDFTPGNYHVDHLKGPYDVAWLSHILHSMDPGESQRLISKAVSLLPPGGLILVHDFVLDGTMASPLFPALFSLNMLVNTKGGRAYSEAQIREMLSKAGVDDVRRLPIQGPNDSAIIGGTVRVSGDDQLNPKL
ncbi:MAG: methyltransferase domain-containing protein [Deltaproteobacteria bacterium]|nr:methyltransferase domain-containing protein [Deltaproteobacteria bacterium]